MNYSVLSRKLLIIFAIFGILLSSSAFSAQSHGVTKNEKIILGSKKATQDFNLQGFSQLKIQFRYENGKLRNIYLHNEGRPVELKLLEQSQILGRDDDWQVRAPNVDTIILHADAYDPDISMHLDSPFIHRAFIFSRSDKGLYRLHSAFYNGKQVEF